MNTFLARAGSNSRVDACFLAIKQSPLTVVIMTINWQTSNFVDYPMTNVEKHQVTMTTSL